MAGRVFSQQLDRSKPLWELWLVQGLTRNRFALLTKTHHAVVDGVAGVDIATVLFDLNPVPEPAAPDAPGYPQPEPSAATLLAKGVEDLLRAPIRAARRLERAVEHPESAARQVRDAVEAVSEVGWNFADPAPKVPLNVEIGSHRRYVWVRSRPRSLQAGEGRRGRHRQRRRARRRRGRPPARGCGAAGSAPRGSSFGRRSPSASAPPTSMGSSATAWRS